MNARVVMAPLALVASFLVFATNSAAAAEQAQGIAQQTAVADQSIIEELRVTASRLPSEPASIDVRKLSADKPAFTSQNSLGESLVGHHGVTLTNSGGPGKVSALRIRGEEATRTLVLIDGIELSDVSAPQTTTNIHHLVLTPDITRVDVLAGPQAFFLGGDAGGVVNIRTTTPTQGLSAQLNAEAGADDHMKLSALLSAGSEQLGSVLSAQKWRTAGFSSRVDDLALDDDDGYDNVTLHSRSHWRPSDKAIIELVFRDVDASTDFDNCGFPRTDSCREEYEQTSVRLGAAFGDERFSQRLSASFSTTDRENFADGAFSFGADGELGKYEYSLRTTQGNWQYSGGVELRQEEADDRDRDQWGFYGEAGVDLGNGFSGGLGLRLDDNDDFGTHLTGRVHGAWDMPAINLFGDTTNIRLRTSYGTGFRAPSLFEEGYNAGPFAFPPASTTELQEERSRGLDVGVTLAASSFSFAATLFSQKVEDEILFDLTSFAGYLQTDGTTKSQGVTLRGDVQLGANLVLSGDYMYNRPKLDNGEDRLRRPRNSGRVSMTYRTDTFDAGASVRYVGTVEDEQFGVGRSELSDYAVTDLVANWNLLPQLQLHARVTNLFDKEYSDVIGFRSQGTAFYAGFRLALDRK